MSDFVYQAAVVIAPGDDGRTTVSLAANYPVSVSIHERVSDGRGGERETTAEFQSPNVHETVFAEDGDDGEGDELELGDGVEPDADEDLPLAAEGCVHVVQH